MASGTQGQLPFHERTFHCESFTQPAQPLPSRPLPAIAKPTVPRIIWRPRPIPASTYSVYQNPASRARGSAAVPMPKLRLYAYLTRHSGHHQALTQLGPGANPTKCRGVSHFFFDGLRFALLRPSYLGRRAGVDSFRFLRLPMVSPHSDFKVERCRPRRVPCDHLTIIRKLDDESTGRDHAGAERGTKPVSWTTAAISWTVF
jgi:hypothetical protein